MASLINKIRNNLLPIGLGCIVFGVVFGGYNYVRKANLIENNPIIKKALGYEVKANEIQKQMIEIRYMNSEGVYPFEYQELKKKYKELMQESSEVWNNYWGYLTSEDSRELLIKLKTYEGNYGVGRNSVGGGLLFCLLGTVDKVKKVSKKRKKNSN